MGAGKTYIIFKTISAHFEKYPNKKLYIIACFRQEILQDLLFDKNGKMDEKKSDKLKKYGIIDLDDYLIIDRVHEKKKTLKLLRLTYSVNNHEKWPLEMNDQKNYLGKNTSVKYHGKLPLKMTLMIMANDL